MEQKKEKKVYAAFDRQARKSWKRAARKAVCSHYSMAILLFWSPPSLEQNSAGL